jgi:hypothetical protein
MPDPGGGDLPPSASPACTDWVVDDFDGGAGVEMRWGYRDNPETDGAPFAELLPVPTPDGSTHALRAGFEFEEPTSIDVTTHVHSAYPGEYAALKFRARAGSDSASKLVVAITDEAAGTYWEDSATGHTWNTMGLTLTPDWQELSLPLSDIVRDDAHWSSVGSAVYHFVMPNTNGVDLWLDDVRLVCEK